MEVRRERRNCLEARKRADLQGDLNFPLLLHGAVLRGTEPFLTTDPAPSTTLPLASPHLPLTTTLGKRR